MSLNGTKDKRNPVLCCSQWQERLRRLVKQFKGSTRKGYHPHTDKAFGIGNPGNHRFAGKGVWELKIEFGPGYRVYYGEDGDQLVILLWGGDKSTQKKDIKKAQDYWLDYTRRQ